MSTTNIKTAITLLCAALLAGSAGATSTEAETSSVAAPDYTVFVDPPTGFVFLKLPQGWKFAGRVLPEDVARLPPTIVTALLKEDVARLAAGTNNGPRAQ